MISHRSARRAVVLVVVIAAAGACFYLFSGGPGAAGAAVVDDVPGIPPDDSLENRSVRPAVSASADARRLSRGEVYGAADVDFAVRFDDHVIPYSVFGVYVMPGEEVDLQVLFDRTSGPYRVTVSEGELSTTDSDRWRWRAPEDTGLSTIEITSTLTQSTVRLNVFVLTPFTTGERELNGYRIGRYEDLPLDGDPVYRPPAGFVELRPDNRNVRVSPHFTLGQFVAKQKSGYPKYLLLREPLLLKLEMLLSEINERGVPARSLYIMSGYRTPNYNRAIGNTTSYSRHLYGGAADVFVDVDRDAYMDDVSGDGRVDIADAEVLADIIEANAQEDWYDPFAGGLGVYAENSVRGPFIHIDVRGHRARW